MKKAEGKIKRRVWVLWCLLVLTLVALGIRVERMAPSLPHKGGRISVAVKDVPFSQKDPQDVQEQVEDGTLPALPPELWEPFKQSLRVTVNDLMKPPEVSPEKGAAGLSSGISILQNYEEKNLAPDTTVPQTPRQPSYIGKPRLAIVIDDCGIVPAETEKVARLPAAVAMSFLPYAPRLQEQANRAKEASHEVLLHLPMQPIGGENPGHGALLTSLSADENLQRLKRALDSFSGYEGVNNHMGSKFTSNREAMSPVVQELKERGLFFLDSRTSGQTVGSKIAKEIGGRQAIRDVFLDDDASEAAIRQQMERAEQVARHKGSAVVIGHPHATTLRLLEKWLPDLQARGFEVVPVKTLAQ